MKAVTYYEFGGRISIETLPDPTPAPDGAVIQVEATGLCRSDWHGWRGHDPDIRQFPHVPGHEFAGVVVAVGSDVNRSFIGQRVTIPFVAGCGACAECQRGNQHICDFQYQPGFNGWGSFAEYVAVRYAEGNLVPLSESMSSIAAAAYPGLFRLIQSGALDPTLLVERSTSLDEAPAALESLQEYRGCGVTIFTPGSSNTSQPV